MKNKIMKEDYKEVGITLIALVITIIVLLILAGISIASLTGENGILNQADTAKTKTEQGAAEEQVKLAVMASYDENGKLEVNELKKELEKIPGNVTITDTNGGFPITVTIDDKYTFEIDNKGNVTLKGGSQEGGELAGITSEDIANSTDKSKYYGAIVTGYDCPNSAGVNAWKIFYADENNIYLITDDYIHYDYCPSSATQSISSNSTYYQLSMGSVIIDYPNGSAHLTNEKIKALNNDYFNVKGYASTNDNMKAVAYMLDTNVWSVFAGNHAEYAIGGPTVELVMKSYSQKYNVNYQAQATNNFGYQISKDGENWAIQYDEMLNKNDSLYVINTTQKASAMWMASTCAAGPSQLKVVFYNGKVYHDVSYDGRAGSGFRPLVCLKSTTKLEKMEDGTYKIK